MSEEGNGNLHSIPNEAHAPTGNPSDTSNAIMKKKKRTRVLLLSTLLPVAAVLLATVMILVILPEMDRARRYDAGMKAYESGNYSYAVEALAKLPDYKESAKYYELASIYTLKVNGKYAEAKAGFTRLGLSDMAEECDYLIALDLKKDGKNKEAYDAFTALGDFKDSKVCASDIRDSQISSMLTQVNKMHAPINHWDFIPLFDAMDELKLEAAKYGEADTLSAAIDDKKNELIPEYASAFFEQTLVWNTSNNKDYVQSFGLTSSYNWGNLKELITQRFRECPEILGVYMKTSTALRGKPLYFRLDAIEYDESKKAFVKQTNIYNQEAVIKDSSHEWVHYWILYGEGDNESRDRFGRGIYKVTVSLKDSGASIASIYFTIGL